MYRSPAAHSRIFGIAFRLHVEWSHWRCVYSSKRANSPSHALRRLPYARRPFQHSVPSQPPGVTTARDAPIFRDSEQRKLFRKCEALTCQLRVADACFSDHHFGNKEAVFSSTGCPPLGPKLLIPKHNYVAAETTDKVADDARLKIHTRAHPTTVAHSDGDGKSVVRQRQNEYTRCSVPSPVPDEESTIACG